MKVPTIQLPHVPIKSFIFHIEHDPFTPWHHHPEFELVYIKRGKGRRLVGDHVARFEMNDLIFLGPYLPHQWNCDNYSTDRKEESINEAYVIQFEWDFIGKTFFEIPETTGLKKFLVNSSRGVEFSGETKEEVIKTMNDMFGMNDSGRFYALLDIFRIFEYTDEFSFMASVNSINDFSSKDNEPMQTALKYIHQNFQKRLQIEDLLEITHKSYSSFYCTFKKTFMMPFKEYVLNVRIGYACKLLDEGYLNIAEVAYDSGFENLSNFNRQFLKIKAITPRQYQRLHNDVVEKN